MKKISTKVIANIIVTILIVFLVGSAQAQKQIQPASESQIAMRYYRNGEYEKAVELYKKLYYTNRSNSYFQYYLKCLTKIKDFEVAEKLVKEQIGYNKANLSYLVELGYLYQLQGDLNKAKSTYEKAIKKVPNNQHQIIRLASAFMGKREYGLAEITYIEGKKNLKGAYEFEVELAQLYYYQRNYEKMVFQYLSLLKKSDQYLKMVQSRLQNAVFNDIDGSLTDILQASLLQALNENPENISFSELLVWLYIQSNNFEGALIQAQAIDMRLDEDGKRIIALARIASDNGNFDVAVDAYEYVVSKGKHLEFFIAARDEMLNVMFKRIELSIDTKEADFVRLEENYISALQETGVNVETVDMVRNLAHLQAFYLHKRVQAWFLLEDAVSTSGISRMTKGELELELANIYLADGKVWEATFAYARIEEYNKHNPVGAEAKYQKARLAYYIGDFEWSMAQLDVLKASTSKLIANDAAHLSLFIYDNTGWDSLETALEIYSRADLLYYQSSDSLALLTLDSVLSLFPKHALADETWYLKGKIYLENHDYTKAEQAYKMIIANYYYDILADKSLFALADLYENHLNMPEDAQKYYQQLIMDFNGSIYATEARKRFRTLRGDKVVN